MAGVIQPVRAGVVRPTIDPIVVPGRLPWEPTPPSAVAAADAAIPPGFDEEADLILSSLKTDLITTDGGSPNNLVTAWTTTNGTVFSPPSGLLSPKYDIANFPLFPIRFKWDGTNASKLISGAAASTGKFLHDTSTAYTWILVWQMRTGATGSQQVVFSNTSSTTSPGVLVNLANVTVAGSRIYSYNIGRNSANLMAIANSGGTFGSADLTKPFITIIRFDPAAPIGNQRQNGLDIVTKDALLGTPSTSNPSHPMTLGARADLTSGSIAFDGGIAVHAIKQAYLSDAQCEAIEAWAAEKFGITLGAV